jgi:hypothetical protein
MQLIETPKKLAEKKSWKYKNDKSQQDPYINS